LSRSIQPLGEQIIIRTIPKDSIGSILIPDSAKGITMMGEKGAEDAVHFVEAEVIAVGPGKRGKGDPNAFDDCRSYFRDFVDFHDDDRRASSELPSVEDARALLDRLNASTRIALTVKPGDRILYHPAVQKFDRKVEGLGEGEFYIILENSVLAVIEE
jgi:co-chaperonin GroES (HSP10)